MKKKTEAQKAAAELAAATDCVQIGPNGERVQRPGRDLYEQPGQSVVVE